VTTAKPVSEMQRAKHRVLTSDTKKGHRMLDTAPGTENMFPPKRGSFASGGEGHTIRCRRNTGRIENRLRPHAREGITIKVVIKRN